MAKKRQKHPVKGLDRHGRKWRWRRTIDGEPVCVLFNAINEQAACVQALEFEKHPHLLQSQNWNRELEIHLQDKLHENLITQTYADTRKRILTMAGTETGITHPRQLTEDLVSKWLQSVAERTSSQATQNSYLTHMRQFCKWLMENNRLYIDPCAELKRVRTDFVPRDSFLTKEEVRLVIDTAKARNDKELELIMILACECGMRCGEITAAKADWVDMQHGTITIPATEKDESWSRKGQVGRKKNVVIEMVTELKAYFNTNGISSPYLIRPNQPWGKWKYRYDFSKKVRNHLKNCGFPDITIHDLRRSFGSNRVIAGRSIEQVAHWMGIHPNTAWKYYARFTPVTGEIEHGSAAIIPEPEPEKKKKKKKKQKKKERSLIKQIKQLKKLHKQGLLDAAEYKLLIKKLATL